MHLTTCCLSDTEPVPILHATSSALLYATNHLLSALTHGLLWNLTGMAAGPIEGLWDPHERLRPRR
jgi:hypothetical protein